MLRNGILSFLIVVTSASASVKIPLKSLVKTPSLKVRIGKSLSEIDVSGVGLKSINLLDNQSRKFDGRKRVRFNCNHESKSKKGQFLASLSSSTGMISFNEKKYVGKIHLASDTKGKRCDVINEIPIEIYIGGLLAKEMNTSWHKEALKAQAVAARTYAFYKLYTSKERNPYHIENSENHQVSGSFYDVTSKTAKAALATKGEILVGKDGGIHPTFFHASCGGSTYRPESVWKNQIKGYARAKCNYCKKRMTWSETIPGRDLKKFVSWLSRKKIIKKKYRGEKVRFLKDNFDRPFFRIYIGNTHHRVKKSTFRRYFGRYKVSSNNFKISFHPRLGIKISGRGMGHGVGMCQIGTKKFAEKGKTYKQILAHYFPRFKLEKIY